MTFTIGIVVGEESGDILGAGLMRALQQQYPGVVFVGIGGTRMLAEGMSSRYPQERLAVMGLVEPLKRLPELLRIRTGLREYFIDQGIDLFIGIDSPDFNLTLANHLRRAGIKTVHYVSPSVWAWRQGRIHKIARSVDLMLTLFPFEAAFYREHHVPVAFVGHPLADDFPIEPDPNARTWLAGREEITPHTITGKRIIALLPGSRAGEVKLLGPVLWQAAKECLAHNPALHFIIPAANDARYLQLREQLAHYPDLPVSLFHGHSREVMAAAELVVMASGTTALEAMLLKKPMIVTYKMAPLSYSIISRLVKSPYVSLPNLLANKALVPELIQQRATPAIISRAIIDYLDKPEAQNELAAQFHRLHQQLRCGASTRAAAAISQLLGAE